MSRINNVNFCKESLKIYKDICKNIYDETKKTNSRICTTKNLITMTRNDLEKYSNEIYEYYIQCDDCYTRREKYREECIRTPDRKKTYNHQIHTIKLLSRDCRFEYIRIQNMISRV